jgi:hypothetical protein
MQAIVIIPQNIWLAKTAREGRQHGRKELSKRGQTPQHRERDTETRGESRKKKRKENTVYIAVGPSHSSVGSFLG